MMSVGAPPSSASPEITVPRFQVVERSTYQMTALSSRSLALLRQSEASEHCRTRGERGPFS